MRLDAGRVAIAGLSVGAALVLIAMVAWWWACPPDPASELRARHHPLRRLERAPAPELGSGVERWRLITARGDPVNALWKPAPDAGGVPAWCVVILGGIGTDDRAALLVPESLPLGVLAVSWPWKGPRRMGRVEFIARAPRIREALLRTPAAVALGVEAVRRACPGARVAMVGASLGVPPTVAALAITTPDALVLVDGAADLERLLRSEVSRELGGGVAGTLLAPPTARLAGRLLSSLEPARHAASRATPVLLVDAARDERYPRECVARLHATFPRATLAIHPGGHMEPDKQEVIAAIVRVAWRWLEGASAARDSVSSGHGPVARLGARRVAGAR